MYGNNHSSLIYFLCICAKVGLSSERPINCHCQTEKMSVTFHSLDSKEINGFIRTSVCFTVKLSTCLGCVHKEDGLSCASYQNSLS